MFIFWPSSCVMALQTFLCCIFIGNSWSGRWIHLFSHGITFLLLELLQQVLARRSNWRAYIIIIILRNRSSLLRMVIFVAKASLGAVSLRIMWSQGPKSQSLTFLARCRRMIRRWRNSRQFTRDVCHNRLIATAWCRRSWFQRMGLLTSLRTMTFGVARRKPFFRALWFDNFEGIRHVFFAVFSSSSALLPLRRSLGLTLQS